MAGKVYVSTQLLMMYMAVLNDKSSMLSAVNAPYTCCGNSVGRKWKWLQHLVKKLL